MSRWHVRGFVVGLLVLSGMIAVPAQAAPPPSSAVPSVLKGNIAPTIPAGSPGRFTVVERSPIDSIGGMGVVLRNNTTISVAVQVKVKVYVGTTLVATSTPGFESTSPVSIKSGSWGLFYVVFPHPKKIPKTGATYHYSFPTPAAAFSSLKVTKVNAAGDQLIGVAKNTTSIKLVGPYETNAFCFSLTSGHIQGVITGFASTSQVLGNGKTVSFTDTNTTGINCSAFLVGAGGFHY